MVTIIVFSYTATLSEASVVRPMTHSLPQQPSRPVAMATAKPVVKSTSEYFMMECGI